MTTPTHAPTSNSPHRVTAEQLRREIAERLGYRIEHVRGAEYVLHHPDGQRFTRYAISEPERRDPWRMFTSVPNWPTDIAAAWSLLLELPGFELRDMRGVAETSGNFWLSYEISPAGIGRDICTRDGVTHDDSLVAICLAWLQFMTGERWKLVPDVAAEMEGQNGE